MWLWGRPAPSARKAHCRGDPNTQSAKLPQVHRWVATKSKIYFHHVPDKGNLAIAGVHIATAVATRLSTLAGSLYFDALNTNKRWDTVAGQRDVELDRVVSVKIKPEVGIKCFVYVFIVALELVEMYGLPEHQSSFCNVVSFTNTGRPLK